MKEGPGSWVSLLRANDAHPHRWSRKWLKSNAHQYDGDGLNLLHACLFLRMQTMVGILLDLGIDIFPKTRRGHENVLHLAAQNGLPACLCLFLRSGKFNINLRDGSGLAPLHWAAYNWRATGDTRCVDLLLDSGADVNAKDGHENKTVLDILFTFPRVFPMDRACAMIQQGARVSGKRFSRHWPNLATLATLQQSLADWWLATRATDIALRKAGMHKDVIPLIIEQVRVCWPK